MKWANKPMNSELHRLARKYDKSSSAYMTVLREYKELSCIWSLSETKEQKISIFDIMFIGMLEGLMDRLNPKCFISCTNGLVGFFFGKEAENGAFMSIDRWGNLMMYNTRDKNLPKKYFLKMMTSRQALDQMQLKWYPQEISAEEITKIYEGLQ